MDLRAADSLFSHIKNEFEKSPQFNLTVWIRPDGKPLLPRRAVWNYHDGSGRKLVRPFVEAAVRSWGGPTGSE
jgi:exopolyphosphatase